MAFNSNTSIFGAKPAAATTGSIFGAQNANTAPKPAGSIFGNAVPNISTFGTQTQTQPAQGSLFGGQQQQQQQPQGSQQPIQPPSLFGQTPQNTQQQGGGLFGNTQQQNTGTSSLFPQTQQAQNQTNTNQTSGFGSGTASSNPLFGASSGNPLFGGASTNTANTGNTLFGGASTGFGAGSTSINPLMGNQSTNSLFGNRQQSQPAMSFSTSSAPGAPPFTKSTRFNDLPDMVKRVLEDIDTYIQGRIQICNNLKQMKLGDEASKGKELIRDVHKDLLHAIAVIQSDLLQTRTFKSKADQTVQDTIIATRIIDGFRYPQHGGVHLKNHAEFPLEFFTRSAEEMKEKLAWCKNTIEAIERKLSSFASQSQVTPQAITTTLEAQHTTFITLVSRTAAVDAELQKVKTLYTQLWRAKTGSARDPFHELDRGAGGEFGLQSLNAGGK